MAQSHVDLPTRILYIESPLPLGAKIECPQPCGKVIKFENIRGHVSKCHNLAYVTLICTVCHELNVDGRAATGHLRGVHKLGKDGPPKEVACCSWDIRDFIGRDNTTPSPPQRPRHALVNAAAGQAGSPESPPAPSSVRPDQPCSPSPSDHYAERDDASPEATGSGTPAPAAVPDDPVQATTISAGQDPRQVPPITLHESLSMRSSTLSSLSLSGREPSRQATPPTRTESGLPTPRADLSSQTEAIESGAPASAAASDDSVLATSSGTSAVPRQVDPSYHLLSNLWNSTNAAPSVSSQPPVTALRTPVSASSVGSRLRRAARAARTPPALRRTQPQRHVLPGSPPPIHAVQRTSPTTELAVNGWEPAVTSSLGASPLGPGSRRGAQAECSWRPTTAPRTSPSTPTRSSTRCPSTTPPGFGFVTPDQEDEEEGPKVSRKQRAWIDRMEACTSWMDFESTVDEFTKSISGPPKGRGYRRKPTTGRGRHQDPVQKARRLQFLYKVNRSKAMREVRGEDSPLCAVPKEEVQDYFTEVFSCKHEVLENPPETTVLPPSQQHDDSLFSPITRSVIMSRLRHCGNTAPGPDNIRYSELRSKDPGAHVIQAILNKCLTAKKIPASWKVAKTILLHKKGDKDNISNWRPISLANCLYKVYTGVIADRVGRWARRTGAVSSVQKGFMPAEGCAEHNFLIQQCIDDAKVSSKFLVVTWLDLRNAFPSVPHASILAMLRQHGVHPHLVDIIEDLYSDCSSTFVTESGETAAVDMKSGVKQGCPLSPIVFNLVIEILLRSALALGDEHGYKLFGQLITILGYADDLVLVAKSPDAMQALLDAIGKAASWLGLYFNAAKCATLAVHKKKVQKISTKIQEQQIPSLSEDQAYQHLGVPTGLKVDQTPDNIIKSMMEDLRCLDQAPLKPWQKLDAIRTFVLPQATFALLTARVKKEKFDPVDTELRRVAKNALQVPVNRASNEIISIPSHQGGANILPFSDMIDVGAVVHAYKMLTCPDPMVAEVAVQSCSRTASKLLGATPSQEELATYLSGSDLGQYSHSLGNIWTAARNASRRLANKIEGFKWSWSETLQRLAVEMPVPGKEPDRLVVDNRKILFSNLRKAIQHHHLLALCQKRSQGKVFDACSKAPESNHFLYGGKLTRFCDWKFIHRARLNVLPLNASLNIQDRNRACRRCRYPLETVAHVLNHCQRLSNGWNNRHRSVIKNLVEAMPPATRSNLRIEQTVPQAGSKDKPDLVLRDDDKHLAAVIDIACPFDNRYEALESKRFDKIRKYQAICDNLRNQGYSVACEAVVVGALGSWDPSNERALKLLNIPERKRKELKRKCVSDVIRWSRDIYIEHMTNHRQYKQNVSLPP